ncbi:hypothetical protein DFH08DRAFT_1071919 [Mycena albidolilacea]|uniref:Uncharacterized protein n=1 Tax=Mycena albidolilacea TaxID=1033008 RepID=A0AAD7AR24_9AGAR|nr:hypothetical protein DFH08DRAFT_1071919 [Mycena albidolilacea]
MALTQSAAPFPGGPSWDDEVVPALRKRLEGESRILSKRISLIEDAVDPSPRPSADRTRTQPAPRINGGGAPKQRARTYSQPKLSEIPNSKPRSPDPSPRAQYQTRIPKAARGRTGSITTNNNNYANGYAQRSDSPADLRRPNDAVKLLAKQPSQDTIHIPLRQTSGLLNEPAPFGPLASAGPSSTTSHEVEADVAPPRPSNDSEERPFEHWYRGEVSRNGGVGELKLGKRAEMLEIANYGHTLKQKQALREAEASNQRRRKRSESTAGIEGQRGSLYLDEEENGYGGHGRVLDEGPLTDVDNVDVYEEVYGDAEGDAEEMSDGDYYHQQYQYGAHDTSTASAPLPAPSTPTPTQTPSRQHGTRIPSPRAVTPTPAPPMQRGMSEPPSLPASGSLSQAGRRLQQTPNAKRGATSPPPASSSSASKRPRAAATPKAKPKPKPKVTPQRDDKDRRSVAYYPSPGEDDGEDLADAIPTWTQPVKPQTGRWDDVVLPVVARKKGLDDHYEKADGSPKPKTKEDRPVEPAAGTFGWDHSKYRPPRGMDEFGRPVPMDDEGMGTGMSPEEEERMAFGHRPLYPPTAHEQQPVGPRPPGPPAMQQQQQQQQRPRSPPPFADAVVNIDLDAAQAEYGAGKQQGQQEEDDGGAGCCKCVVM